MQPLDVVQEEYVKETKAAMPKTMNQRTLHSTLFTRGANLGVGLRLVPYLRERWGRQRARVTPTRPPSTRAERAEVVRQLTRTFGFGPDPHRTVSMCSCGKARASSGSSTLSSSSAPGQPLINH